MCCPSSPSKSQIPVIADIHFQPKYVFAGDRRRLRRRPGQPGQHPQVRRPGRARSPRRPRMPASRSGSASTRARWTRGCWRSTARRRRRRWSRARSGRRRCSRSTTSTTSRSRSSTTTRSSWCGRTGCSPSAGDWPLHLGVTEAGPGVPGHDQVARRRSASCCREGIGDTIRVSLSAPPVEEVKVGLQILQSLNLRERKLEIVSCPSCGRAQVDVYTLAERGHRRARGHGGAAARRRHGLRRQRAGRGPRGRPGRRVGQRQGPDLRQGRGHQDRARSRRSSRP